MIKNIFLKSKLRQPVRNIILVMLIGIAAFAFVSRVAEYAIVRGEILRIEERYRSIGYLQHRDFVPTPPAWGQLLPPLRDVNAIPAAEIISRSPHILREDRRQFIQGILPEGMSNTNFYTFANPILGIRAIDYVYFYGTFDRIAAGGARPDGMHLYIHIYVDEVAAGFEETISPGPIRLMWLFSRDELPQDRAWWQARDISHPFENLEPGERYFFKGSLFRFAHFAADTFTGRFAAQNLWDDIWYIPVPHGESIDFTNPVYAHLEDEILTQNINQRTMFIVGTVDMSAMPTFQPEAQTFMLVDYGANAGRYIEYDDYLNANPVAVVNMLFAQFHGLSLGDTITMTLRDMQTPIIPFGYQGWGEHPTEEIELTIIGFHHLEWRSRVVQMMAGADALGFTSFSQPIIYVPLSVFPEGFGGNRNELSLLDYSFELTSPRHESAFINSTFLALYELGYEVIFFDHGARVFFDSVNSIILSITINLIAYSIASLFVLFLACFIYLHQNKRVFAIYRAIGMSSGKTLRRMISPAVMIWIPVIILGSVLAWNFAAEQAVNTLTSLDGIDEIGEVVLPINWLIWLCAGFVLTMLSVLIVGGLKIAGRSVIEMLQEQKQIKNKRIKRTKNTETEPFLFASATPDALHKQEEALNLLQNRVIYKKGSNISGSIRFIHRHIIRTPIKGILTITVAMFFVAALIWLSAMINQTQEEIDMYLDLMPITGTVEGVDGGIHFDFAMGEVILKTIMDEILANEFVLNPYIISGSPHTNIIPVGNYGQFRREYLDSLWFEFNSMHEPFTERTDFIFAVSCLETFITESRRVHAAFWGALPFDMWFLDGFDIDNFYYTDYSLVTPIPVIVHEDLLNKRGIGLGDIAYITHNMDLFDPWFQLQRMEFFAHKVHVIGAYRGLTSGGAMHPGNTELIIMPLDALRYIRGDSMSYIMVRFRVAPAYNYRIGELQEQFDELFEDNSIFRRWGSNRLPLELTINDDAFNHIIIPMQQNLELLQILYPIALVVSFVLAIGFTLLLMLQSARNAAIMHVLGLRKIHVRVILSIEQLIITLLGVLAGLIILPIFELDFTPALLTLPAIYFTGAAIGGIIGAIVISNKPPLELLKVRE